ncbi:MAG: YcjX family protein, partial [Gemmataceae bacterium]
MQQIHIGLTGLSRAGKTVFLTCAAHAFLDGNGDALREFKFHGWKYSAKIVSSPEGTARFPYLDYLEGFRKEPPEWPPRTSDDVRELRIRILFVSDDRRRRDREIELVFVDYPGERLLDVALLETDFDDWSDAVWKVLTSRLGSSAATHEFIHCVRSLERDQRGDVDALQLDAAKARFAAVVRAAHAAKSPIAPIGPILRQLQGNEELSSPFFPLNKDDRERLPHLRKVLRAAYSAYCNKDVRPFLKKIATCSHQIVLVDVLDILRSGIPQFNEVQDQMRRVLECIRQVNDGRWAWLMSRWPFGRPSIRKVSFCATKADQATGDRRENLAILLRELFKQAEVALQFGRRDLRMDFVAFSAHRSTEDVEVQFGGGAVIALRGDAVGQPPGSDCF